MVRGARTNSSLWSACYGPNSEGQQGKGLKLSAQAYLSARLLHVIHSITADRGIEGSAHPSRVGREYRNEGVVALIRQQRRICGWRVAWGYSRCRPSRSWS